MALDVFVLLALWCTLSEGCEVVPATTTTTDVARTVYVRGATQRPLATDSFDFASALSTAAPTTTTVTAQVLHGPLDVDTLGAAPLVRSMQIAVVD